MSGNLRTMAMAESTATTITSYDQLAMPGLLQSPEYADCIYRMTGLVAEERIPNLVQYRTELTCLQRDRWRKSSYSGGAEDSNCVEVSLSHDALVRDSKNASGDVLAFSSPAWSALIGWIGSRSPQV